MSSIPPCREQSFLSSIPDSLQVSFRKEEKAGCALWSFFPFDWRAAFWRVPIEPKFTYLKGEYIATLQREVENKNEKQLKIWVKQYATYTYTQILLGEYFQNIEMVENYIASEASNQGLQLNRQQIVNATGKFLKSQQRILILLFHPDKHTNSGIDLSLIADCATLIGKASEELNKYRFDEYEMCERL